MSFPVTGRPRTELLHRGADRRGRSDDPDTQAQRCARPRSALLAGYGPLGAARILRAHRYAARRTADPPRVGRTTNAHPPSRMWVPEERRARDTPWSGSGRWRSRTALDWGPDRSALGAARTRVNEERGRQSSSHESGEPPGIRERGPRHGGKTGREGRTGLPPFRIPVSSSAVTDAEAVGDTPCACRGRWGRQRFGPRRPSRGPWP